MEIFKFEDMAANAAKAQAQFFDGLEKVIEFQADAMKQGVIKWRESVEAAMTQVVKS